MRSAFHKISRVGSLVGATKWYLSEDCLLAAKRVMYAVEYKRFYLSDLESIVVWPTWTWLLRAIIPGVLLAAYGAVMWRLTNLTVGAIFGGIGLAWAILELALGPTATARIRTTGMSVDMPIVKRMRRARRVLAEIDAAVRVARGGAIEEPIHPIAVPEPANPTSQTSSESAPTTAVIGDLS